MAEIVGVDGSRSGTKLFRPALIVTAVLILGAVGVNLWASKALDMRVAALQEEIAERRIRDAEPRPVLWGEPVEGNAAEDYRRAEALIADVGVMDFVPALKASYNDSDFSPEDHALLDRCTGIVEHVRLGIRKTRCDWEHPYELAASKGLIKTRQVANVMMLEAHRSKSPATAVQLGLDILALGRDMGRGQGVIGAMIGIALRAIACRSLENTLRRRSLTAAHYERIIDVLGSLEPLEAEVIIEDWWRSTAVWMAAVSGRPLDPFHAQTRDHYLASLGPYQGSSPADARLFHDGYSEMGRERIDGFVSRRLAVEIEHEWGAIDGFRARTLEVIRLPYPQREAAALSLREEAKDYAIAGAMVGEYSFVNHFADLQVIEDGVRVLAAAHLYRLETGGFPSAIAPLEAHLKGVPLDPFRRNAPLSMALQNGVLRVYSWYEDGQDGGGPLPDPGRFRKGGDLTLSTTAPPN